MADFVHMWIADFQSRPSMQPPLTETTFFAYRSLNVNTINLCSPVQHVMVREGGSPGERREGATERTGVVWRRRVPHFLQK